PVEAVVRMRDDRELLLIDRAVRTRGADRESVVHAKSPVARRPVGHLDDAPAARDPGIAREFLEAVAEQHRLVGIFPPVNEILALGEPDAVKLLEPSSAGGRAARVVEMP